MYQYCLDELNKILASIQQGSNSNIKDEYHITDVMILKKELEHLKIKIINISLELYVLELGTSTYIQENDTLHTTIENTFKDTIESAYQIGYDTGIAISENIFSHFYFYQNEFEKALLHIDKSIQVNEETYDSLGYKITLEVKENILTEFLKFKDESTIRKNLETVRKELDGLKNE